MSPIEGSRQHPADFVGKTVLGYSTTGPQRQDKRVADVLRASGGGLVLLRFKDGSEQWVNNMDWTVLETL